MLVRLKIPPPEEAREFHLGASRTSAHETRIKSYESLTKLVENEQKVVLLDRHVFCDSATETVSGCLTFDCLSQRSDPALKQTGGYVSVGEYAPNCMSSGITPRKRFPFVLNKELWKAIGLCTSGFADFAELQGFEWHGVLRPSSENASHLPLECVHIFLMCDRDELQSRLSKLAGDMSASTVHHAHCAKSQQGFKRLLNHLYDNDLLVSEPLSHAAPKQPPPFRKAPRPSSELGSETEGVSRSRRREFEPFEYQLENVTRMRHFEKHGCEFCPFGQPLAISDFVVAGNVVQSYIEDNFSHSLNVCRGSELEWVLEETRIHCKVGLVSGPRRAGKTVQMCSLILGDGTEEPDPISDSSQNGENSELGSGLLFLRGLQQTNATLVVLPEVMHSHWLEEIERVCGWTERKSKVNRKRKRSEDAGALSLPYVIKILSFDDHYALTQEEILNARVVVTTYEYLLAISDNYFIPEHGGLDTCKRLDYFEWRRVIFETPESIFCENKKDAVAVGSYRFRFSAMWVISSVLGEDECSIDEFSKFVFMFPVFSDWNMSPFYPASQDVTRMRKLKQTFVRSIANVQTRASEGHMQAVVHTLVNGRGLSEAESDILNRADETLSNRTGRERGAAEERYQLHQNLLLFGLAGETGKSVKSSGSATDFLRKLAAEIGVAAAAGGSSATPVSRDDQNRINLHASCAERLKNLGENPEEGECSICYGHPNMITGCCGQLFCSSCLSESEKKFKKCAYCNHTENFQVYKIHMSTDETLWKYGSRWMSIREKLDQVLPVGSPKRVLLFVQKWRNVKKVAALLAATGLLSVFSLAHRQSGGARAFSCKRSARHMQNERTLHTFSHTPSAILVLAIEDTDNMYLTRACNVHDLFFIAPVCPTATEPTVAQSEQKCIDSVRYVSDLSGADRQPINVYHFVSPGDRLQEEAVWRAGHPKLHHLFL